MATHSATKWILSIFSKKVLYVYDTLSSDNGFLRFLWDHCHSFCSYFHLAPPHPLILSSHFYRMSDSHKRANAKYYWKNREKCLQYAREYHQANIETIHEKKRLRPRPSRAKSNFFASKGMMPTAKFKRSLIAVHHPRPLHQSTGAHANSRKLWEALPKCG